MIESKIGRSSKLLKHLLCVTQGSLSGHLLFINATSLRFLLNYIFDVTRVYCRIAKVTTNIAVKEH